MTLFNLKPVFLVMLIAAMHGGGDIPHSIQQQKAGKRYNTGYVILLPTGERLKSFPVLQPMPEGDSRTGILDAVFTQTFVSEMVSMNDHVQTFLARKGFIEKPEPVYILFSGRIGGFPMKGFYLRDGGRILDKTRIPYVELATVEQDYQSLSSITQVYPHELAHIFYEQLSQTDPVKAESYSTDMHYFSIVTDYLKAFNEGYAESFENISRNHEKNRGVLDGTSKDTERYSGLLTPWIRGFDRDFRWPLRIGLYRLSMITWYQKLEDYKRYVWATNGLSRYASEEYSPSGMERAILYRNACVIPDTSSLRNAAQAASNEGEICSFFTGLMESPAKDRYQPREFYLPFVRDTAAFSEPKDQFNPVRNQLIKEYFIIHKYLQNLCPGESPMYVFLHGYMKEFPGEVKIVRNVFHRVTGLEIPEQTPPELWVLNKTHSHNSWQMAQFGGTAFPFYTFNINTAGWMDFATLEGVSSADGRKIIEYRDASGPFQSFSDLGKIPGLDPLVVARVRGARLVKAELDSLDPGPGNMMVGFLTAIVKHLLMVSLLITLATGLILAALFYRKKRTWKSLTILGIRTFFKVLLLLVVILVPFVFLFNPFLVLVPLTFLLLLVNYLRTRHNPVKRRELILSTLVIAVILSYSLV
jgi:hypothetical protein